MASAVLKREKKQEANRQLMAEQARIAEEKARRRAASKKMQISIGSGGIAQKMVVRKRVFQAQESMRLWLGAALDDLEVRRDEIICACWG